MAVIQPTTNRNASGGAILVKWETLTATDSGAPFVVPCSADLTFQVIGTFNGATCTLQGSNDGTNWATLTQRTGTTAMAPTAAFFGTCNENPVFVRPLNSAGGASTDIDVLLAIFPRAGKMGY